MFKFIDVEQGNDEWFNLRLGKITASNFAIIMANYSNSFGKSAQDYALKLALERIIGKQSDYSFKNSYMKMGNDLEPIARILYQEKYFVDVRNGGFFDCGFFGSSPDGLIGDDGCLEIKSVLANTHWATLNRGSFDPSYKYQLTGHLLATNRDYVDFCSYCPDFPSEKQILVYRTTRNDLKDELIILKERIEKFEELIKSIEYKLLN